MIEEKNVDQQILKNATELFLTKGFKSVTMDDIANEMGISKKTIYSHYSTKTSLVKHSSDFIFNFIKAGIDQIREQKLNPIEELFTINDFVFFHLKNDSSSPEFQLQKYYPKIHSSLNIKKFDAVHECVINNIQRGKEIGIYRKGIDEEVIFRFYFFSINQIKDQNSYPLEKFKPYELTTKYLDYHIRGISTQKGIEFLEEINNHIK